jgi:hypothetical protein
MFALLDFSKLLTRYFGVFIMLKPLLVSSGVVLLLVACASTETKPISSETAKHAAKVTQPTVKPVLKPHAAVKPKVAPVKAAEPVPANSDVALGKQWASCAGDLEALRLFLTDTMQINPSLYAHPQFQASLTSYRQLPLMRDAFYAYAQTASDNPALMATQYKAVHTQQYTQYRMDVAPLLQAWKQPGYDPAAYPQWQSKYTKQVLKVLENWTICIDSLKQQHSRFDSQVTPNLRYATVDARLKQAMLSPTMQNQKPTNKRAHKVP